MLIQNMLTADPESLTSSQTSSVRTSSIGDAAHAPQHKTAVAPSVAAPRVAVTHPGQCPERHTDEAPRKSTIAAEKILRSFNTWAFKREQPSNLPLMLELISAAIARAEPVSFVLYWGKGPRCTKAEPDLVCLDYLAKLAQRVHEKHKPGAAIKLIFTDTHATLNGHSPDSIQQYFSMIEEEARKRNFGSSFLSRLTKDEQSNNAIERPHTIIPLDMVHKLSASAKKWFHGDGTPEAAALKYYHMNMDEKRAVEFAFPQSIFITFNGSDLRDLFPTNLPIFYMYSLRRGTSVKPWFMQDENTSCADPASGCNAAFGKSDGFDTH